MKKALVFEAGRTAYGIEDVKAITVGDLIAFLQDFDEDTLFILSHDRGYTYGTISERDCYEAEEQPDGTFEEVEW